MGSGFGFQFMLAFCCPMAFFLFDAYRLVFFVSSF